MPGSKQACPTVAACWSPATPQIAMGVPKSDASVWPKSAAQSSTLGNMHTGISSRLHIVWLQRPLRMSYNKVRAALVASVTCTAPLVNFQIRKLSTVPNNKSPAFARSRAPGTFASIQLSFVPEKYGSSLNPVRSVTICSWP